MKDGGGEDLELLAPFKGDLKKKICIGAVSHRSLQADRPEDVAGGNRKALKNIPPDRFIVSTDCGVGRPGLKCEIAVFQATGHSQGVYTVRPELRLPHTTIPP